MEAGIVVRYRGTVPPRRRQCRREAVNDVEVTRDGGLATEVEVEVANEVVIVIVIAIAVDAVTEIGGVASVATVRRAAVDREKIAIAGEVATTVTATPIGAGVATGTNGMLEFDTYCSSHFTVPGGVWRGGTSNDR